MLIDVGIVLFQSASGAGARHMRELIDQMERLGQCSDPSMTNSLDLAGAAHDAMKAETFPTVSTRAIRFKLRSHDCF